MTVLLVAAMIAVAGAVTRRMVRPIRSMTVTAAELAGGNWDRRIPEDRCDELGELARAFNKMVDQLGSTYQQLQDIIEFLPDATFVVDRDKMVIAWNRGWKR